MVVEHHAGTGRGHGRVRREVLQDEVAEVVAVADGDVDDEVLGSAEEEELHHVGELAHLGREGSHLMAGARADRDADERLQAHAHRVGVDRGGEPGDHAALDEAAHAGHARRRRDARLLGEAAVRGARVGPEEGDELAVDRVEGLGGPQFLRRHPVLLG